MKAIGGINKGITKDIEKDVFRKENDNWKFNTTENLLMEIWVVIWALRNIAIGFSA